MKISKYDHTRTAVGKENDTNKAVGILYQHPGKKEDLEIRLVNKNTNIKSLYNIFTPIQVGTEPRKPKDDSDAVKSENYRIKKKNYDRRKKCVDSDIVKTLNKYINRNLFNIDKNRHRTSMKDNDSIINNISSRGFDRSNMNGIVLDEIIELSLRKSLRKQKNGIIKLLNQAGNRRISNNDNDIIEFLNTVRSDYNKLYKKQLDKKQRKKNNLFNMTIRSIKNQNLVIQPVNSNNKNLLKLPIPKNDKETTHKTDEKQGLNSFLMQYADIHESERKECLRKLRRLLDLYFATPQDYDESYKSNTYPMPDAVDKSEFDVWQRHEDAKSRKGVFTKIPEDLKDSYENHKKLDKIKEKQLIDELKRNIKLHNKTCYRYAIKVTTDNSESGVFFKDPNENKYWIHHIENAVERIFDDRLCDNLYKMNMSYLSEKVWKDILNAISIKYIAIGKAVYHFSDIEGINNPHELPDIINSFDYEMIKARETFQRELAVHVAFAVHNFSKCSVKLYKGNEDLLLWEKDIISEHKQYENPDNELKAILQFFGGISQWDKELFKNAYKKEQYGYDVSFLYDLKNYIYALRNESFHFDTYVDNTVNKDLIGKMFEHDANIAVSVEKIKFHSNNLPMFYEQDDLKKVMNKLYRNISVRGAQVPAFRRILSINNVRTFMDSTIEIHWTDSGIVDKWEHACYYLLKEIYYNDFLQSDDIRDRFFKALENLGSDMDNQRAVDDFKERCKKLHNQTVSELCQTIMTEYNLQNNKRTVDSSNDSLLEDRLYKHYKLFLERTLSIAFRNYINKNKDYNFIKRPKIVDTIKEEDFLPDWKSSMYEDLINDVKKNPDLQKWYVTSRFLNGKSLNHLIGTMRSYIQYVEDISKRARKTGNELHKDDRNNAERVKKAIEVVDMCIKLSDRFTKSKINDYFASDDEYVDYLCKYVDINRAGAVTPKETLKQFCSNNSVPQQIYMDNENIILNRNVIMAKLYGPDNILANVLERVKEDDVKQLNNLKETMDNYIKKGKCENKEEQIAVLEYQKLKNKIELRNVTEFAEVINDLQGQLINWSFLRERDLLYFQLGFHYMSLHNESKKPKNYEEIETENGTLKNAILRQITGMYINGIGIYIPDENNESHLVEEAKVGGAGSKIGEFCAYSKSIYDTKEYGGDPAESLYYAGLEVFEVIGEHDAITDTRRYIDHFKYYSGKNKISIIDLYSEVFDRFFTYDMKYKKNVPNLLQNILLRHSVIVEPRFDKIGKKIIDKKKTTKDCARIEIRKISSDRFKYKIESDGSELEVDAKNKEYMDTIMKILYYPEQCNIQSCTNEPKLKERKR